jgi:hypothetical protein
MEGSTGTIPLIEVFGLLVALVAALFGAWAGAFLALRRTKGERAFNLQVDWYRETLLGLKCFAEAASPADAMLLEHFHGAATRVPVSATAYPHRREGYNLGIFAQWMDPDLTERWVAWARTTYDGLKPHYADARYSNYLGDDEPPEEIDWAYGPNLRGSGRSRRGTIPTTSSI